MEREGKGKGRERKEKKGNERERKGRKGKEREGKGKENLGTITIDKHFDTYLTTGSPEAVARTPGPAQMIELFPVPPLILTWVENL